MHAIVMPTTMPVWRDSDEAAGMTAHALLPGKRSDWRTAGDFIAATGSPGFRAPASALSGYRSHPALYRAVRS